MTKFDTKIFEYLKKIGEWKDLGDQFKAIYAEMPRDDIENMTQEDMDKLICEELWDHAVALVSRLAYEKLQYDLDNQYKNGPVGDLKKAIAGHTLH